MAWRWEKRRRNKARKLGDGFSAPELSFLVVLLVLFFLVFRLIAIHFLVFPQGCPDTLGVVHRSATPGLPSLLRMLYLVGFGLLGFWVALVLSTWRQMKPCIWNIGWFRVFELGVLIVFGLNLYGWSRISDIDPPDAILKLEYPRLSNQTYEFLYGEQISALLPVPYKREYRPRTYQACIWVDERKIIDPFTQKKKYNAALEQWVKDLQSGVSTKKPDRQDFYPSKQPRRMAEIPAQTLLKFPPPEAKFGARQATDDELELAKKQSFQMQEAISLR